MKIALILLVTWMASAFINFGLEVAGLRRIALFDQEAFQQICFWGGIGFVVAALGRRPKKKT